MSIYRLSLSTVSRGAGRSAVAAAAYRAGERLTDARTDRVADYRRRREIRHTEIVGWAGERGTLWNAAEGAERRKDSVVARELQLALPNEISDDARRQLAVGFARWLRDRYGVAVDVAVHGPGHKGDERNHHAHLLFSTRVVDGAGTFGAKTRVLDVQRTGSAEVEMMRREWAERVNDVLTAAGVAAQVDHRSYVRQGVRRESEHVGRAAVALEAKGQATDRGSERRARRARNAITAPPRVRPGRRSRLAAAADVEAAVAVDYAAPEALADVAVLPEAASGEVERVRADLDAATVPTGPARRVGAAKPSTVPAAGPGAPTLPSPLPGRPPRPV
mgnify:CR=1 FL=1